MPQNQRYTKPFVIDHVSYDVPLVSVTRKFNFLDKFAQRTMTGVLLRELIGVYATYDFQFGFIEDTATHDELFDKLSEPVESHIISFCGVIDSPEVYVSGLKDEIRKIENTDIYYQHISCTFTGMAPFRRPSDIDENNWPPTIYAENREEASYIGSSMGHYEENPGGMVWVEDGTSKFDPIVTRGITIDGIIIKEPFVSIERHRDILDKSAIRDQHGLMRRDVLGTFSNYTLQFGDMGYNSHSQIMNILTAPIEFHTFGIPIGGGEYFEFEGYISGIQDSVSRITASWRAGSGSPFMTGLTCSLTARAPYLTPEE